MSTLKKCYCKKDFISKLYLGEKKRFFVEGKIYHYYKEDGDNVTYDETTYKCAWVIYGSDSRYGLRFHLEKGTGKIIELHNYYDYFESDRLTKLKKIERL